MYASKQHVLALAAAIGFIGFAGTASAATCEDIEKFAIANRPAMEKSMLAHFSPRARVTVDGGSEVRVENAAGCRVRVNLRGANLAVPLSTAPGFDQRFAQKNGSMVLAINFNPEQGDKMCVHKSETLSVEWADMGRIKELAFKRRERGTQFITGCMF